MSRITESARGEECMVRIPRICNFDSATTVFAHANGTAAGKGIGMKSLTCLGTYACACCHDVIDGRRNPPEGWTRADVKLAAAEGHYRTLQVLVKKGLVIEK